MTSTCTLVHVCLVPKRCPVLPCFAGYEGLAFAVIDHHGVYPPWWANKPISGIGPSRAGSPRYSYGEYSAGMSQK